MTGDDQVAVTVQMLALDFANSANNQLLWELTGEPMVLDLVVDHTGALPDSDEPGQRCEVGGQVCRQIEHDRAAVSAGRGRGS